MRHLRAPTEADARMMSYRQRRCRIPERDTEWSRNKGLEEGGAVSVIKSCPSVSPESQACTGSWVCFWCDYVQAGMHRASATEDHKEPMGPKAVSESSTKEGPQMREPQEVTSLPGQWPEHNLGHPGNQVLSLWH